MGNYATGKGECVLSPNTYHLTKYWSLVEHIGDRGKVWTTINKSPYLKPNQRRHFHI